MLKRPSFIAETGLRRKMASGKQTNTDKMTTTQKTLGPQVNLLQEILSSHRTSFIWLSQSEFTLSLRREAQVYLGSIYREKRALLSTSAEQT